MFMGIFSHPSSSAHFPFCTGWENFNLNNDNCPRVISVCGQLKEKYAADH